VIHVWFIVEPGAPGLTLKRTTVRGTGRFQGDGARLLGRGAGSGLEPRPGDFIVEKMP